MVTGAGLDWSAKHTAASGAFNAASGATAAAVTMNLVGASPLLALAAGGMGAAGSVLGGLARDDEEKPNGRRLMFRASCWLTSAGWVSYAMTRPDNVFSTVTMLTLATGAAVFGSIGHDMTKRRKRRQEALAAAVSFAKRQSKAEEWISRVERVCRVKGCTVVGIENWAGGTGYTVEMLLPEGGTTVDQIAGYSDGLKADAKLPTDCSVTIWPGVVANAVLIKVATENALLKIQEIPDDCSELSFKDDFDIGVMRDSKKAMVNLRENSAVLVGQKRSGKTNEIQVFISRFLRMVDLKVWVIDFNGGGLALPWLRSWVRAGCPGRCPIDWVATTPEEALLMVTAAVNMAKARKSSYQSLMDKHNTDLLPLSNEVPGIMLITDEGAEILGVQNLVGEAGRIKRQVAESYIEVLRIAGSVGINELTCGLRATADVLGNPMVKKMSRVKVGMLMDDAEEMAFLFGWHRGGVTVQEMVDQGFGAFANGESNAPRIFKGYRIVPRDMDRVVASTYQRWADLDQISVDAGGKNYSQRWARLTPAILREIPELARLASPGALLLEDRERPAGAPEALSEPSDQGTSLDAFNLDVPGISPEQAARNMSDAIEASGGDDVGSEDDRVVFEEMMRRAGLIDWGDPSQWSQVQPPANEDEGGDGGDLAEETENMKNLVFGMVKASGPNGIKPADIDRALRNSFPDRKLPVIKTITRWLRADPRLWQPNGYSEYAVKPENDKDGGGDTPAGV